MKTKPNKAALAKKIAALVDAPVDGFNVHTFNFNGVVAKTVDGDDRFMTTRDVSSLLHKRAGAVFAAIASAKKFRGGK